METVPFFASGSPGSTYFTRQDEPKENIPGLSNASIDHKDRGIDLNELLICNKQATFLLRVNCSSMINAGIFNGDRVIVDRSIKPASGKIVIAVIDGEMLIRRLDLSANKIRLIPETPGLATIDVSMFGNFKIWGVVVYIIRNVG